VEQCSINFLSISKLAKNLNCEIIFKMENIIFQDLLTKEKIVEEYLENDLYFLGTNKFYFNAKKDDLYEVCHKRVGHSSDKILKFMFDVSKNYYRICEVCSLAKHIKFSFCNSNSNSKINKIFEFVHSDVLDPPP
jgi:hypothetical protein